MKYCAPHARLDVTSHLARPSFDDSIVLGKDPAWPRISIVTPSFNQAGFLEKAVLSVLNQNYPNLEFIVVDGGSSDSSPQILEKYRKYFSYWVSEKDDGQADALRKGFSRATGDILAWLNSDDFYLPGIFHHVADRFRGRQTDVIYGEEYYCDQEDRILGIRPQLPFPARIGPALFVFGGFWINQPTAFWTRDLYDRVGGVNKDFRFAMDNDLLIRFALSGARFTHTKRYVVGFRTHEHSKTSTIQDVGIEETRLLAERYGNQIPRLLRNAFLTRNLGRCYQLRHLVYGNPRYIFVKYFYKLMAKVGFHCSFPD